MTPDTLIRRCHDLAGFDEDATRDADSLIGFFQLFRPDGAAVEGLFAELACGDALHANLRRLYAAAGDDRRPQGGRDAYFVIRNPPPADPDLVGGWAESWLRGIRDVGRVVGDEVVSDMLAPLPSIRILEGIPPKHPKDDDEKSHLLLTVGTRAPKMVEQIAAGPIAAVLRSAYYFVACDPMLRDYLMWPLYLKATDLDDPFATYFELWSRGIKYRIFGESQIDLYIPRR